MLLCNRSVQICDPNRAIRLPSQPRRVEFAFNDFPPPPNSCGGNCCHRGHECRKSSCQRKHKKYSDDSQSSESCDIEKHKKRRPCNRGCCRNDCCIKAYDCLEVKCGTLRAKLSKSANTTTFVSVGQQIVYFYEIFNIGTAPIDYPIYISDDKLGGMLFDCNYIMPCGSQTFTAVYTVSAEDVQNKTITNTAKAFIKVSCDELVYTNEACLTLSYGNTSLTGAISQSQPAPDSHAPQLVTVSLQVFNAGPTQANNVILTLPYPLNVNQGIITTVGSGVVAGINSIVTTFPVILAGQNATSSFTYNAQAGSYTWLGFITSDTVNINPNTTLTSNTITVYV